MAQRPAPNQKVLAKKFGHQPITKSNLSDWRHGGYQDWRADQAREARIQRISESGASLEHAEAGDLFENFARIAVAELMADFDSLHKLRGEDRSRNLHNLVRDLARLQNSFNRSRWAELAWTKWNDRFLGPDDFETEEPETANAEPPTRTPISDLPTPSPSIPVVLDGAQSQAVDPHDPAPPCDPFKIIHYTRCDCNEPCPKCHAPGSDYPLDEALRDIEFHKKYRRHPVDRHGNHRHLMNYDCACFCDRCAEPGRVALPRNPIIRHANSRDENLVTTENPPPPSSPSSPSGPLSPQNSSTLDPRSDFLRKMSRLKGVPLCETPMNSTHPFRAERGEQGEYLPSTDQGSLEQ